MKKVAIISEFNPFHNGHKYLIDEIHRKIADPYIISTMSGSFVQRGEPAIVDKWSRTKMALYGGVDLVIELPVVFSCQNAEVFSKGALSTLESLKPDYLAFGAEIPDREYLIDLSSRINKPSESMDKSIQKYLSEGNSYIVSKNTAMLDLGIIDEYDLKALSSPNNILALEYINAIEYLNLNIDILPISRAYVGHNDTNPVDDFASASTIRKFLKMGKSIKNYMSSQSYREIRNNFKPYDSNLFLLLKYNLLDKDNIINTLEYEEGIENRIINYINSAHSFEELIEASTSKRITRSRIRRILLNSLIGITKNDSIDAIGANYTKVLGSNNKGFKILANCTKPYISKYNDLYNLDDKIRKIGKIESRATDLYSILTDQPINLDKTQNFIIKKE